MLFSLVFLKLKETNTFCKLTFNWISYSKSQLPTTFTHYGNKTAKYVLQALTKILQTLEGDSIKSFNVRPIFLKNPHWKSSVTLTASNQQNWWLLVPLVHCWWSPVIVLHLLAKAEFGGEVVWTSPLLCSSFARQVCDGLGGWSMAPLASSQHDRLVFQGSGSWTLLSVLRPPRLEWGGRFLPRQGQQLWEYEITIRGRKALE